jgi:hypothetical protein
MKGGPETFSRSLNVRTTNEFQSGNREQIDTKNFAKVLLTSPPSRSTLETSLPAL